ncbi:eCIS core domain-containing protein [Rheinheimera soli]|uniref:eCIS core domain-containing protein n=1 Tax=Rheinheimera soli TaxID=443616 RepID=UPI001E2E0FA8|nr:DUF4157 domain-containing protein [Rheinheimera soli]
MAEFKVEHKKQQSSEDGTVSQRKGETVLPDNRGQVSQARALTDNRTAQLVSDITAKPNNTGLPNQLKAGIESLSGMSMDHVKVHYNSSQPAQLNAHAYAQGSNIHLAPGQEKHLPHEAWHVVQQAQGRVKPMIQMKAGVAVNDDQGLEHEADSMGAKALNYGARVVPGDNVSNAVDARQLKTVQMKADVVQLMPGNFYRTYQLPFKGLKFDGYKGERNPHAAQTINKLRAEKVIETSADLIGGHLLKAELGGADVRDNVVAWSAQAESRFSAYEGGYQAKIQSYHAFLQSRGQLGPNGEWTWPFATSAQFAKRAATDFQQEAGWGESGGWSKEELNETLDTLSYIPVETMVNPGNTIDFFTNSGDDISGQITLKKKIVAGPGGAADAIGAASQEALNALFKNRVEQNWKLMISTGKRLMETMKHELWHEHLEMYWQEQVYDWMVVFHTLSKSGPIGDRKPIAPKKEYELSGSEFFTRQPEMTKSWENMRKAAISEPIELQRRTYDGTIAKLAAILEDGTNKVSNAMLDWNQQVNYKNWPAISLPA